MSTISDGILRFVANLVHWREVDPTPDAIQMRLRFGIPAMPDEIGLHGKFLMYCDPELPKFTFTGMESKAEIQEKRQINKPCGNVFPYAEKTHMVLRVAKSPTTLGIFDQLVNNFSDHAQKINEVTQSSSRSGLLSATKVDATLEGVRKDLKYSRAKQRVLDDAKTCDSDSTVFDEASLDKLGLKDIADDDKQDLVKITVSKKVDCLVSKAMKVVDESFTKATTSTLKKEALDNVVAYVQAKKADWPVPAAGDKFKPTWISGWKRALEKMKDYILSKKDCSVKDCFDSAKWDPLVASLS